MLDVSQWHTVKETPLRVSLKAAWALGLRIELLNLIVFPSLGMQLTMYRREVVQLWFVCRSRAGPDTVTR